LSVTVKTLLAVSICGLSLDFLYLLHTYSHFSWLPRS
jgi:hypothetical protein